MTDRGRRPYPTHGGGYQPVGLLHPVLAIHSDVIDQAVTEIRQNPTIEVGGKFVGYVEGDFSAADEDWRDSFNQLRITILGNLDAGPGRDRSAVHHYSDTDYQVRLFQRLVAEFPSLCFVGIWHSHHPNGLHELSGGDRQTGLQVVNGDEHDLDLLLSSLAVDSRGLVGGRHFVFFRGHERFYEIDGRAIQVIRGQNPVADAVAKNARWLLSQRPNPRSPLVRGQGQPNGRAQPPPRQGAWLQSDEGRAALAFDNAWLRAYPTLRPALRDGSVIWQGPLDAGSVDLSCAYQLPADPRAAPVAEFSTAEDALSLRFSLAEPASRAAKFAARLEAFSTIVTSGPLPRAAEPPSAAPVPASTDPAPASTDPAPATASAGQSDEEAGPGYEAPPDSVEAAGSAPATDASAPQAGKRRKRFPFHRA